MKISDRTKAVFKVIHTTTALILLGICGIFVYEKNFVTFESYADVYAVIPGNVEFEGDEPITFFVFADTEQEIEVDLTQKLMCDYGDGNGFGMISSNTAKIDLGTHRPENVELARGIATTTNTYTEISSKLRILLRKSPVADFLSYDGQIPNQTSQCFVKLKFSKQTPRFKITKEHEDVSYPFDYIWYFTTSNGVALENDD